MTSQLSPEEQRAYARRRWDKDTIRQIAADLGRPYSTVSSWGARGKWGLHRRGLPSRVDWADVRRRLDAGEPWGTVLDDWQITPQACWPAFRRRGWPTPCLAARFRWTSAMPARVKEPWLPPFIRLVREPGTRPGAHIRKSLDAVKLLRPLADAEEVEVFWVLALDSRSQARGLVEVTRGTVNGSLIHVREVFRAAICYGATGIIVAHNHPSGNPEPSAEDRAVTRQLVNAGRLLDLPVYDHVVLAGKCWYSFSDEGHL